MTLEESITQLMSLWPMTLADQEKLRNYLRQFAEAIRDGSNKNDSSELRQIADLIPSVYCDEPPLSKVTRLLDNLKGFQKANSKLREENYAFQDEIVKLKRELDRKPPEPKECGCPPMAHPGHCCCPNCRESCKVADEFPKIVREAISNIILGLEYKVKEGLMPNELQSLARLCFEIASRGRG